MAIQESGEMYLETIYILGTKLSHVRAVDISEQMNFSKPSVSRALGLLKDGGYLKIEETGFVSLTEIGEELAKKIYERHTLLSSFLVALGVPEKIADEDACKIEHHISDLTFEAIKKHVAKK